MTQPEQEAREMLAATVEAGSLGGVQQAQYIRDGGQCPNISPETAIKAMQAFAARPTAGIDREAVARCLMAWEHDMENGNWPDESVQLCLLAVNDPHSGDCTKNSWPCLRCHAEDVYRRTDAILALLPAAANNGQLS